MVTTRTKLLRLHIAVAQPHYLILLWVQFHQLITCCRRVAEMLAELHIGARRSGSAPATLVWVLLV